MYSHPVLFVKVLTGPDPEPGPVIPLRRGGEENRAKLLMGTAGLHGQST